MDRITLLQKRMCAKFGSAYTAAPLDMKLGLSRNFASNVWPVHAVRHCPEGDTTGWYIWCGEWSEDPDFFHAVHVVHMLSRNPEIIEYLGLAPGWRFLMAPDYLDVWKDDTLA